MNWSAKLAFHLSRHFSNGRFVVVTRKHSSFSSSSDCSNDSRKESRTEPASPAGDLVLGSSSSGIVSDITFWKSCNVKSNGGYLLGSFLRVSNIGNGRLLSGAERAMLRVSFLSFALLLVSLVGIKSVSSNRRDDGWGAPSVSVELRLFSAPSASSVTGSSEVVSSSASLAV